MVLSLTPGSLEDCDYLEVGVLELDVALRIHCPLKFKQNFIFDIKIKAKVNAPVMSTTSSPELKSIS
jgi:hypothetical protein